MSEIWRPDKPGEKCGIVAVTSPDGRASRYAFLGVVALKHRGPESVGIASSDQKTTRFKHGPGFAINVFSLEDLAYLHGDAAIGHTRYSTSRVTEKSPAALTQPYIGKYVDLAHNGNIYNTVPLQKFLDQHQQQSEGFNDSGLIHTALDYLVGKGVKLPEAMKTVHELIRNQGAANLVIMDKKGTIAAFKDGHGIRPLAEGLLPNGGHAIASESHALKKMGATFTRELNSGELVVIEQGAKRSFQLEEHPTNKLCVLEVLYIMKGDSLVYGRTVDDIRYELGKQLGKEFMRGIGRWEDINGTVPVPKGGIRYAQGFSDETRIPLLEGLTINPEYEDARSFMLPRQKDRIALAEKKFDPHPDLLKGKRVVSIDDTKIRGSVSGIVNNKLKRAGAVYIVDLAASPPFTDTDNLGVDLPTQEEMVAHNRTREQIALVVNADRVDYLSPEGFDEVLSPDQEKYSKHYFGGPHPHQTEKNTIRRELVAVR